MVGRAQVVTEDNHQHEHERNLNDSTSMKSIETIPSTQSNPICTAMLSHLVQKGGGEAKCAVKGSYSSVKLGKPPPDKVESHTLLPMICSPFFNPDPLLLKGFPPPFNWQMDKWWTEEETKGCYSLLMIINYIRRRKTFVSIQSVPSAKRNLKTKSSCCLPLIFFLYFHSTRPPIMIIADWDQYSRSILLCTRLSVAVT